MNKRMISALSIAMIAVVASVIIISTNQQIVSNNPIDIFAKGVSLSPKSYASSDFTDFFQKAKQAGTIVSWAGDWNELNNTEQGGPTVVASLASTYGYKPVIEAQFFTQSNGSLLRPLDNATMQAYKEWAIAFVLKYNLKYLGLGVEVNVLYEKSPADFDKFVQLYNEVYDAVKAKSPQTQVFTVFQLEKIKGLNGGLFGGSNDPAAEWQLLDRFAKSDLIAFTTYPGLIYKTPDQIPSDYYTEIKLHTAKPVAFTEIGWHTDANPSGWESSESKQSEFITKFFNLSSGLNKEMAIWSFLYDQNTTLPFNSMGLWRSDGTPKPGWNTWVNAK